MSVAGPIKKLISHASMHKTPPKISETPGFAAEEEFSWQTLSSSAPTAEP